MKPLWHEDHWEVSVAWKRPRAYEKVRDVGSDYDDDACLYLISARFSNAFPKAIYIGKTWSQTVSTRLNQNDHKKRYAAFVRNYPRHRFFVSYGIVSVDGGRLTEGRVNDIERILIYSNEPDHASNVRNFCKHGVTASYQITNRGSRCTLPQVIALGMFVQN